MQAKITVYANAGSGLSLQLCPDTDAEYELLRAMWRHGTLETGHPCEAEGDVGFYITAFQRAAQGGG